MKLRQVSVYPKSRVEYSRPHSRPLLAGRQTPNKLFETSGYYSLVKWSRPHTRPLRDKQFSPTKMLWNVSGIFAYWSDLHYQNLLVLIKTLNSIVQLKSNLLVQIVIRVSLQDAKLWFEIFLNTSTKLKKLIESCTKDFYADIWQINLSNLKDNICVTNWIFDTGFHL